MSVIIDFIQGWAKLIIELWAKHPFVGAIVSIAAVGGFLLLEQHRNSSNATATRRIHIAAVVLAWLIIVSVLGFLTDVVTMVLSAMWSTVMFFYGNFEAQPIFVLAVLALAAVAYATWELAVKPRRPFVRAALVLVVFFVVIGLGVPLIGAFTAPAKDKTPTAKASTIAK